jgi:hypothetical protein
MTRHLGKPIPSPALMEHIGTRFRRAVESYASANEIPWVKLGKDDRKIAVMQPPVAAQAATGKSGVAAIGVSQEFQRVRGLGDGNLPWVTIGEQTVKKDPRPQHPH